MKHKPTAKKKTRFLGRLIDRLRGRTKAKAKGPTQADCVAHGLMLAAMSGTFKKNGW